MRVLYAFGRGKQDDKKLASVALCWHAGKHVRPLTGVEYDEVDILHRTVMRSSAEFISKKEMIPATTA